MSPRHTPEHLPSGHNTVAVLHKSQHNLAINADAQLHYGPMSCFSDLSTRTETCMMFACCFQMSFNDARSVVVMANPTL